MWKCWLPSTTSLTIWGPLYSVAGVAQHLVKTHVMERGTGILCTYSLPSPYYSVDFGSNQNIKKVPNHHHHHHHTHQHLFKQHHHHHHCVSTGERFVGCLVVMATQPLSKWCDGTRGRQMSRGTSENTYLKLCFQPFSIFYIIWAYSAWFENSVQYFSSSRPEEILNLYYGLSSAALSERGCCLNKNTHTHTQSWSSPVSRSRLCR